MGGVTVFLLGSAANPLANLRARLLDLVAVGHAWDGRIEFAGLCVALAAVAVPRVVLGATGWMRSLPVRAATTRRAAVAALCATQGFAVVVALLAPVVTLVFYDTRLSPAKLAALPIIVVAAAAVVVPVRNPAAPSFALLALLLAVPGRWLLSAGALAALAIADRTAGPVVPLRRRRVAGSTIVARDSRSAVRATPVRRWMSITIRALTASSVASALLLPAMFVAFAWAVRRHGPEVMPETTAAAIRACGALALTALVAGLANVILRARPVWPWARSLPWSARQRVTGDFVLLALALTLVPIALSPFAPKPAIAVAVLVLPVAAGGASALRAGAGGVTGAAAECVAIAVILGVFVGITPIFCIPVLLVTVPLLRLGTRRERSARATRWSELHHHAPADPAWAGTP